MDLLLASQSLTSFNCNLMSLFLLKVKARLQIYKQNSEAIISAYSDVMIKVLGDFLSYLFGSVSIGMPSLIFVVWYHHTD